MKKKSFADLFEEAEQHDDYWVAGAILEFTEGIVREMERQNVTRTKLARRLGTTPAYVTKILRGKANFTLDTMVRLARALDTELHVEILERGGHSTQAAVPQRTAEARAAALRARAR
jgi:transcriptional regulator with XRE-family HTH domain